MKQKTFTLLILMNALYFIKGQIGINTDTPQTTLDIRAKNHNGIVSSTDGVLVPRVNALSVNGTANGQLVYLIADSGSFTKGFHYWDGTVWKPISSSGGSQDGDAWGVNGEDQTSIIGRTGSVGIGILTPDTSSLLDIKSTNKGFLPPRVNLTSNTMDLDGIPGQAIGLMVYDTGINLAAGYYYWDGSVWRRLSLGGGVSQSITFVTGDRTSANPYIVEDSDYYIFIRLSGTISGLTDTGTSPDFINTNHNIRLPDPALNPGRELYLINDSWGVSNSPTHAYTNYHIFGTYDNQISAGYATNNGGDYRILFNYPKVKIVSDGVRWIAIQITIV